MGSVGGKTPTEPKSFICSSLPLGMVNKIKLKLWVIRSEDEHECEYEIFLAHLVKTVRSRE
jgi:hypothetical protein